MDSQTGVERCFGVRELLYQSVDRPSYSLGITGFRGHRTHYFLQPALSGMPQWTQSFYPPHGDAETGFLPTNRGSAPSRGVLPDLLFSGGALSEPRFFGYGEVCFGEETLYRHFDQCALPQ